MESRSLINDCGKKERREMTAESYIREPFNASTRQRTRALSYVGITLAGLGFLRLFNPSTSGFYPPCLFHSLTGLYCPGCGVTRALYHLAHGHPSAAFAMNPLFVMLFPILIYLFLSYALLGIRGRGLPNFFANPTFLKLLFWIAIAFGIIRNLPFYPFNLLAPHNL
jgi:hypothetical protein